MGKSRVKVSGVRWYKKHVQSKVGMPRARISSELQEIAIEKAEEISSELYSCFGDNEGDGLDIYHNIGIHMDCPICCTHFMFKIKNRYGEVECPFCFHVFKTKDYGMAGYDMNSLKRARILKGVTQFDLRIATGIHQSRISLLENGKIEPRDDEKIRFSMALDIPVKELFPVIERRKTILTEGLRV